jgi:hypothetical protein
MKKELRQVPEPLDFIGGGYGNQTHDLLIAKEKLQKLGLPQSVVPPLE